MSEHEVKLLPWLCKLKVLKYHVSTLFDFFELLISLINYILHQEVNGVYTELFLDVATFNCLRGVTHKDYKKILFCYLDLQNFADIVTSETHLLEKWH